MSPYLREVLIEDLEAHGYKVDYEPSSIWAVKGVSAFEVLVDESDIIISTMTPGYSPPPISIADPKMMSKFRKEVRFLFEVTEAICKPKNKDNI